MSGKGHNKKRNSLLLYEFLVRTISRALVEDDKKRSTQALKILRKHYRPGTNLYKEFRLMNSLVKTTVSSEHVAATILKEAKTAAAGIDHRQLDREKSLLIRTINHSINDDVFYDQHVNEYRDYATIQSLINEWRSTDKDISKLASYEDHLMKMLTTPKSSGPDHTITEDSTGTSRLLMKVMTKKLNEKYSGVLSDQQRALVKAYALSSATSDDSTVVKKLHEIRQNVMPLLDAAISAEQSEYVRSKMSETRDLLINESCSTADDDTITRFMLYSRLQIELESKE